MNNRIIRSVCLFLSLVLFISSVPEITFASDVSDNNITENYENYGVSDNETNDYGVDYIAQGQDGEVAWSIDSNGALVISGKGDCGNPWLDYADKIVTATVWVSDSGNMSGYFYECKNLKEVCFPNGFPKTIQNISYMFYNCSLLKSVTGLYGFSNLYDTSFMFSGCTSLQSLDFGGNGQYVINGEAVYMFENCSSLECVRFDATFCTPGFDDTIFSGCNMLNRIEVPAYFGLEVQLPNRSTDWKDQLGNIYKFIPSDKSYPLILENSYEGNIICNYSDGILTISGKGKIPEVTIAYDQCPWASYIDDVLEIRICEGITGIGFFNFSNMPNLRSVSLPKSLEKIEADCFYNCKELKKIRYAGSQAQWRQLIEKQSFSSLSFLKKTGVATYFDDASEVSGFFNYVTYEGGDHTASFYYDCDFDWFFDSAYGGYNHELAKMSLKTEMAAFGTASANTMSDNICGLMDALGFSYTKAPAGQKNEDYSICYTKSINEGDFDDISTAIGSRIIEKDGNRDTLILVAIRGAGYDAEWGGNFHLGVHGDHEGFNIAAEKVKNRLDKYVSSINVVGNINVWIVGYSRAAAVGNLVAKKLDDEKAIGGHLLFSSDVFAYCFECPQNTISKDAYSDKYGNIENIVNPIDLVPMVAPSSPGWNFTRYGITNILPTAANYANYRYYQIYEIPKAYKSILEYKSYSAEEICNEITKVYYLQDVMFNELVDLLAEVVHSREQYGRLYQDLVDDAICKAMVTDASIKNNIKIEAKELLPAGAGTIFQHYIEGSSNPIEKSARTMLVKGRLDYIFAVLIGNSVASLFSDDFSSLCEIGNNITYAHYPELCLAWLEAVDGKAITEKKGVRKILVNCPVDVVVSDVSGNVIGHIKDDQAIQMETGVGTYIDQNGQKVVVLPMDASYNVEIIPTDDGEMSYTIVDYQSENNDASRVVNYSSVPITKGDKLYSTIERTVDVSGQYYDNVEYTLTRSDDSIVEKTIDSVGEEIEYSHIESFDIGNGYSGICGDYLNGQFIMLEAYSGEGETFIGWFDVSGNQVSNDASYRFEVVEDRKVFAIYSDNDSVFNQDSCYVVFDSEGGTGGCYIPDFEKGSNLTIPAEIPYKEGYNFLGWYTEKNGQGTKATERMKVRTNLILYAYWVKEDCTISFATDAFRYYNDVSNNVVEMAPVQVVGGATYTFAEPAPIENYSFGGWFTGEDGTGTRYTNDTLITDDVTLYPYWRHTGFSVEEVADYTYTGKAIKPVIAVYDGTVLLTKDKDYTVKYSNNTNAADKTAKKAPTITVTGKGNYTGTETITFSILKKNLSDDDVAAERIVVNTNIGKAVTISPAVKYNGTTLSSKKNKDYSYQIYKYDFDVSGNKLETGQLVEKVTEAGAYKVVVTGQGNYIGTKTIPLDVVVLKLISKMSVAKIGDQKYTGAEIKPAVKVSDGKKVLTPYVDEVTPYDYSVSYSNNVEAGTASVTITGNEDAGYTGTKIVTFKIKATSITKAIVKNADGSKFTSSYAYTGLYIRPNVEVSIKSGSVTTTLVKGTDYTVSYSNNKKVGTATILITGIGAYSGSVKKTFNITPYDLKKDTDGLIEINGTPVIAGKVVFEAGHEISVPYAKGGAKVSDLVVTYNGRILKINTDYTVSYKNNKAVADLSSRKVPTLTVKGKGLFKESISIGFVITQQSIDSAAVKMTVPDSTYSTKKNGFKSTPVLKDSNGQTLKAGTDYQVNKYTYVNDTDITVEGNTISRKAGDEIVSTDIVPAGTVIRVMVTGKGGYGAGEKSISADYTVRAKSISSAKLKVKAQEYTGKAITPRGEDVELKISGQKLTEGVDYEIVSYSDNVKQGKKAKIVIRGIGNYSGSKSSTFTIKKRVFKWWWR